MGQIDKRLAELGVQLPTVGIDANLKFVPAVVINNIVYSSGAGADAGRQRIKSVGKVGRDLTVEEGKAAARHSAINVLSFIKWAIGDLDRVKRIVNLVGYINSAPGFNRQPEVLNGASEFLIQLWGESGKHTRAAIAASELGGDTAVECCLIVELHAQGRE